MTAARDVAVLIPAAGAGVRMGPGAPKALRLLAGEPLLVHAIRNVAAAPSVGLIVVAAPPDAVAEVTGLVPGTPVPVRVVPGGATRQASVASALSAVPAEFDLVLVHDAARALTPPELVEAVAAAVRAGAGAVVPALPVVDTIKRIGAGGEVAATVDRSVLRAVQTPQGFRRETLAAAHAGAADDHTDDAGLAEQVGVRVETVPGDERAFKITRPFDLVIAEAHLASVMDVGALHRIDNQGHQSERRDRMASGAALAPHWPHHPVTADEYDSWPEELCRDIEIIDGMVALSLRASFQHNQLAAKIIMGLNAAGKPHWRASGDFDLRLCDVPLLNRCPDAAVVRAMATRNHPIRPQDVLLAVEIVSPGSETVDREHKPVEYARAGIQHYWRIEKVDIDVPVVHTYVLDEATGAYVATEIFAGLIKASKPFPVEIDLQEI